MTRIDDRIAVWLTDDQVADSIHLADALARTGVLLNVDSALMAIDQDGILQPVTRMVLQEIIARHLTGRRIINRGTVANPDYSIEQFPIGLTEQIMRNMLSGQDVRKGSHMPGGSLADRVPKVQPVLQPHPARAAG